MINFSCHWSKMTLQDILISAARQCSAQARPARLLARHDVPVQNFLREALVPRLPMCQRASGQTGSFLPPRDVAYAQKRSVSL